MTLVLPTESKNPGKQGKQLNFQEKLTVLKNHVTVMSPCWHESKIGIQKNRTFQLKLVLLCTTELQLCEGEMREGGCMNLTPTHTKENPVMGEMRVGVGSVTAWLKDGGQVQ